MESSVPAPSYRDSSRPMLGAIAAALRPWQAWLPLIGVTALALALNVWSLTKAGYGNTYYAAAVRSMVASWHNFFFAAFDPGGFISVDKPPVFLWVDALSARVFGYSSLSLLLPSAIAGALSVALLWLIMRRRFGITAATVAGLVLALTPISVAVDRLNLPEPFLILTLLGAVACVLQSLESRRWLAWTLAAGVLVGLAFNIKMLAGWIPAPAIGIAIIVGMQGNWWLKWREWIPRVLVYGGAALLVSVAWMLIVDNWPASSRPYVGGSHDNSVYDLALGYNGLDRVEGNTFRPGAGAGPAVPNGGFGGRQQNFPGGPNAGTFPGGGTVPGGRSNAPTRSDGRIPVAQRGGGNATGAGGIIAGNPDPLRMFDDANGGQIGWLLPLAAFGGVMSLWRWRDDYLLRAAVVACLGWVLLFGGVFSYTQGIYHSYYTSALAPGIAALVGMTAIAVPDLVQRHRAWLIAALGAVAVTAWVQLTISGRFDNFFDWVPPLMVAAVAAGAALLAYAAWEKRIPALAGSLVMIAGLLLIPAAWSGYEAVNTSSNATLPQAGPRIGGAASRSFGSQAFDSGVAQLAAWLEAHREPGAKWDLATSSAQNASTLIADFDLSVMAIGGFSGNDPTITPAEFGQYVTNGDIRYVLTTGSFGGGFGRQPISLGRGATSGSRSVATIDQTPGATSVLSAVEQVCEPVPESSLSGTQYPGSLYDCAGHGADFGN